MRYRLEVSEEQLKVINTALESYFRTHMGQFFDFTDEIAFRNFTYKAGDAETHDEFDMRINRRNKAQEEFDKAYMIACPQIGYKTDDEMRAIDIHNTIRHFLWERRPEPKSHDTNESYSVIPMMDETLPSIEIANGDA